VLNVKSVHDVLTLSFKFYNQHACFSHLKLKK
jgi:hypothetical protein